MICARCIQCLDDQFGWHSNLLPIQRDSAPKGSDRSSKKGLPCPNHLTWIGGFPIRWHTCWRIFQRQRRVEGDGRIKCRNLLSREFQIYLSMIPTSVPLSKHNTFPVEVEVEVDSLLRAASVSSSTQRLSSLSASIISHAWIHNDRYTSVIDEAVTS